MASKTNETRDPDNEAVLRDLEFGDLVEFPRYRETYSHWGVYIGKEELVHLTGLGDGVGSVSGIKYDKAVVKIEKFWKIVNKSKAKKNNDKDSKYRPSSVEEILKRIDSNLREVENNPQWDNCEHFASYIRYGEKMSEQEQSHEEKD